MAPYGHRLKWGEVETAAAAAAAAAAMAVTERVPIGLLYHRYGSQVGAL